MGHFVDSSTNRANTAIIKLMKFERRVQSINEFILDESDFPFHELRVVGIYATESSEQYIRMGFPSQMDATERNLNRK